MKPSNLAISGMFLEMSRGFINQEIELKSEINLNSIEEIPELVKLNIKFTQFAGSIIFSMSSIEAYVNLEIDKILRGTFKTEIFSSFNNYTSIQQNIADFKKKYSTADKKEALFKRKALTKKINMLYRCFGLKLLSESSIKSEKKLWDDFEKLQSIRHELIHPKPFFIESNEFKEFFNLGESEFKEILQTPIRIRGKLFVGTPLFQTNKLQNAILNKYVFNYKGDAVLEHLLLTSSEYTYTNVKMWGTRWIF